MKIAVFVKQVPDSAAKISLDGETINLGDAPLVINPWDEYAVEAALHLGEEHSLEVVAISMGPETSQEALKHALAMGATEAILISDDALISADAGAAARVFASAVNKVGDVDLAIFGKQAIDSDTGLAPAMTARALAWPLTSLVSKITEVDLAGKQAKLERSNEEGRQSLNTSLPAVLSIAKDFGEPRYPSFMGIRKAAKAEIPVWSLSDLGIDAPPINVTWPALILPPEQESKHEIVEGASPEEIANNLADKIIAEGVL